MIVNKTYLIKSDETSSWLQHEYYKEFRVPPSSQALTEALGILDAKAKYDGVEREVHVRVAEHDDKIYVDLTNDAGEAVEIDALGWRIVSNPPVHFRRPASLKPLPRPEPGGSAEELRNFVNVRNEDDWKLLTSWIVQAFNPNGPYPVLVLLGEQGSAKTTTARIIRAVVDPFEISSRSAPRNEHDLVIAASRSHVVSIDNLSGLPPWISDALCRLATGGGFGTRTLYENDEETIFDAIRPVILNGITNVVNRPDLLDRAIVVDLPRIPEESRRTESELWDAFKKARPRILGGLMDAVSGALRDLPQTQLTSFPRMADFAKWATAAESGLGWKPGDFMRAYEENRAGVNEVALEADPVATSVVEFMSDKQEWIGSLSELLEDLNEIVGDDLRRYKTWPKQPQNLSNWLRRSAPVLRREGIEYEDLPRTAEGRKKRLCKLTPPVRGDDGRPEISDKDSSDPSLNGREDHDVTTTAGEATTPKRDEKSLKDEYAIDRVDGDAHDGEMQLPKEPRLVLTPVELQQLEEEIDGVDTLAVDLETTGLDPRSDRTRLISISTEEETWLVDCFKVDSTPLLETLAEKRLIFHNAAFDLGFLTAMGFEVGAEGEVVDTMLMSQIVGAAETSGKEIS